MSSKTARKYIAFIISHRANKIKQNKQINEYCALKRAIMNLQE